MNIITEVLSLYPTEYEDDFQEQFEDWTKENQFQNIDPIDLKLRYISTGSDRIVYATKHPNIYLKAAFGPQEIIIPDDFDFLYLPVFEFKFPVPLQDPNYQEGRTYGQFQLKVTPYYNYKQQYAPTRALQKKLQDIGCDIGFANAVIKSYGLDTLEKWIETFSQYSGQRAPSSQNWGYLDDKPIIFDYGRIIEQ